MKKRTTRIIIYSLIVILIVASSFVFLALRNHYSDKYNKIEISDNVSSKVSQNSKILEYIDRPKNVVVSNEGYNLRYPKYGEVLKNISEEEKDNLINENKLLRASDTTYNSMDSEGNLYLDGVSINRKLYKHSFASGLYFGDVLDSEKANITEISIKAGEKRNYITGLYAPAGEVIKFEISGKDLDSINGYTISIGQVTHTDWALEITKSRNDFSRMPNLSNVISVSDTVTYFGSYFGGPIYINPNIVDKEFTITITGAIEYFHYIHGYTSKVDVERMVTSSAPYFDFEVWDKGVRHSGPRQDINFSYEELYKMGDLWENISRTSRNAGASSNANLGVSVIYDTFVFAGSACAFRNHATWVNAPTGWLNSSVDYNNFIRNGSWGIIHEFNHHYQEFGIKDNTEVTNNAMSIISYILYTNISSYRSETLATLTGWNRFLDPYQSLKDTLTQSEKNSDSINYLGIYTDLIHAFGTDIFIEAVKDNAYKNREDNSYDYWYDSMSKASGYDLTYYFEDILHYNISSEFKEKYQNKNLPVFIPVASLYQVGRGIETKDGKKFIQTVRPFEVNKNRTILLNFNNYLMVPEGVSYEIKSISKPKSGSIVEREYRVYEYLPGDEKYSGEFEVVVSLDHPKFGKQDVSLLLNLKTQGAKDEFSSDKIYVSEYVSDEVISSKVLSDVEVISISSNPWDDSYSINNVFDDDNDSHYHNEKNDFITSDNPFELVLDLKDNVSADSLIIHGRDNLKVHMPTVFKLYLGNELDDLKLVGEYTSYSYSNLKQQVYFNKTNFRYLKLVVTETDSKQYIAISKLELVSTFKGKQYKPSELGYYVDKNSEFNKLDKQVASFNYLVKGNGVIRYSFNGKGFGLYLKQKENVKIEVKVNDNVFIKEINNNEDIKFIELFNGNENKKYDIEIKVISGNLYIDSFAINNI